MNFLPHHLRNRLALRQTLLVIFIAVVIGLMMSLFQAVLDFRREEQALETNIRQLIALTADTASQALYHLDEGLGNRLTNGLFAIPAIHQVRFVDDFDQEFISRSRPPQRGIFSPLFSFYNLSSIRHKEHLIFKPNQTPVGYIEVTIDPYPIFHAQILRSGLRLVVGFFQYFVMGIIIAFLFYRGLTKPLLQMTKEIAAINPSRPEGRRITVPPRHAENELGLLGSTMNRILAQILILNRELEQRVEERTAELSIEREQLLSIFDSIDEVIYVADPVTYRILFVNEAFKRIWKDGTGRLCFQTLHGRSEPCPFCTNDRIFGDHIGKTVTWEYQNEKTTNWFRCLSRGIRWPDGRMVRYEMAIDITTQKQNEQRLEERSHELEQINGELETSISKLHATQKQLVQAEKLASLGSMVARIAHEINTPVGNSVTAASFLADRTRDLTKNFSEGTLRQSHLTRYIEHANEASEIILLNLKNASQFVSSIKRVAADQVRNEPCDFMLNEQLDDSLISLRPELRKTSHKVIVNCPPALELHADPGAITQIVNNLVNNSLTHAFAPGQVGEMRFDITETDDMVEFVYRDNGKGLDPTSLRHILDPFYTTRRGSGGTGLGMHVVYNLVSQTLKGTIECQSPEEGGIRVLIRFPRKPMCDSLSSEVDTF